MIPSHIDMGDLNFRRVGPSVRGSTGTASFIWENFNSILKKFEEDEENK